MSKTFAFLTPLVLAAATGAAQPQGTAFTYQGRLTDGGLAAAGTFDFRFILYDASVGGSQVGAPVDRNDVLVAQGLFTLALDFGAAAFNGNQRYLELAVRPGTTPGAYTSLGPRQELTPAPAAIFSAGAPWSGIADKPSGFADDNDDDALGGLTCASGQIPKWGGVSWFCSPDEGSLYFAGDGLSLVQGNLFILADGGVATPKLGDGAVTTSKLGNTAVTGPKLADGAVDTAKLGEAAVTSSKIGIGAVTSAQIATGTIVFGDLNQNGCALNQVIKWNGAVWGCSADENTTYSAGPGLNLAGTTFSIPTDGVVTAQLANGAVTSAKLGAGSVTSAQIADGTIALADLGANGCAANQVMKWNGTAWTCATDADSGDITAVTAGAGLTGGASSGDATVAVNFAGAGAASTAARSDHNHLGQTWSGTAPTVGLTLINALVTGFSAETRSSLNGMAGVYGIASAEEGVTNGVRGSTASIEGRGVFGDATATGSVTTIGVLGRTASRMGYGVLGKATATDSFAAAGVRGEADGGGYGVYGTATATSGVNFGVYGRSESSNGTGVYGNASSTSGVAIGIYGRTDSPNGYAGYFFGDVSVTGVLSRPAEATKIDHPLDPENKYLLHAGVASSDMKNLYDGVVTTDASGYATVALPDWFEAVNRDFRYQLTVLDEADGGAFVQAKLVKKIAGGRFTLRTSVPHTEVSWQVTGIRWDRFAERHRFPVEQDKLGDERGTYLRPQDWDAPATKGVDAPREKPGY